MAMRRKAVRDLESTKEMTSLVQQACLVAKDAVYNLRDFLENSSNMAFIAVQDCEKELDRAERKIDDGITRAITQVSEAARPAETRFLEETGFLPPVPAAP